MTTLGIDLGTTNTAAALDGCTLELAGRALAQRVLPSVVAFPPSGATLVGTAARDRRAMDPKNTLVSTKRLIGRGWFAPETREFERRYPLDLVRTADDGVAFDTRAGVVTPIDVATRLLATVREQAPRDAAAPQVVIGVPSSFDLDGRKATLTAARGAGFDWVRIIDEPIATAWAYHDLLPSKIRFTAIYDLGGGTFDLAIVDRGRPPFQVVGRGGDPYLGGDDLDRALADWAAATLLRERGWDLASDRLVFDRLVVECEHAKIRLSRATTTTIDLAAVDPAAPAGAGTLVLERSRLAALATDLVRRSFGVCDEVLGRAGVKTRDLDAVLLAGGCCLLPPVQEAIAGYFGRTPCVDLDPLEVVAIGASMQR
jgi:molecular chaperone DnaK